MLTYNRKKYIERSIRSLYLRAGVIFDLYVFDDNSDKETQDLLMSLQKEYNFNLSINKGRKNIGSNFCDAILHIPKKYKYYTKVDSDIEILSDDLFLNLLEIFEYRYSGIKEIKGLTPRIEGVFNYQKYPKDIEFFKGHTIRLRTSICFGCCMVFSCDVFLEFKERVLKKISNKEVRKWGIDTDLYDTVLSLGAFAIVEDLSVYHIDNAYGQRRIDEKYFINRKRWNEMDLDEVWFIKVSKLLYPIVISKLNYEKIKKASSTFEEFFENCKLFLKDNQCIEKKIIEKEEEIKRIKLMPITMKTMYKISSPLNFSPDSNMKQGTFKYFSEIPIWAKNNPRLVIEKENVSDDEYNEITNPNILTTGTTGDIKTGDVFIEEKQEDVVNEEIVSPISEIIENIKETIIPEKIEKENVKKRRGRPKIKK
jgi:glycosyltransferase involved in cell wall biosynthesis